MNYQNKQSYILAKQNLSLAKGLLYNKKYYDWVVTALYYSALMCAKTLYEVRAWPIPTQHRTTKNKIGWNQSIGNRLNDDVKINFDALSRASQRFRYIPNEALSLNYSAIEKYLGFYKDFVKKVVEELKN